MSILLTGVGNKASGPEPDELEPGVYSATGPTFLIGPVDAIPGIGWELTEKLGDGSPGDRTTSEGSSGGSTRWTRALIVFEDLKDLLSFRFTAWVEVGAYTIWHSVDGLNWTDWTPLGNTAVGLSHDWWDVNEDRPDQSGKRYVQIYVTDTAVNHLPANCLISDFRVGTS